MKALGLLLMLAAPATAEHGPDLSHYMAGLAACVAEADEPALDQECFGHFSNICSQAEKGGETIRGLTECNVAEAEAWEVLLNNYYKTAMDTAKERDTQEVETLPEFAVRADKLRSAQRAWIAYRDSECQLIYATWGSDPLRHVLHSRCLASMTADRVIALKYLWSVVQ